MATPLEQAAAALKKVKLKEKVTLLYGKGAWDTHAIGKTSIGDIEMHDGPCGIRKPCAAPKSGDFIETSYPATCFPAPCLTACSWDPSLIEEMGERFGLEAIDQKTDLILTPGVNIKRNPLCGRNFEYLSEDPLLAGKMGAGFINGVQSQGIGACIKHFAANNQEYRRLTYSAEIDERALRDLYLKSFEIAIKESDPWAVMCSYNRINGVYSSDNDWLLKDVLRDEWKYDGVVMSDWGATFDPILSHNHGLDLEMPCFEDRRRSLKKAVQNGTLDGNLINQEAARIAALSFKKALRKPCKTAFNYGMSHQIARKVACQSMVLAKNSDGLLPLTSFDDICLIGALAKDFRFQGAGSAQVVPTHLVNLFDALNSGRPQSKLIPFEKGYPTSAKENSKDLLLSAVNLASTHDKVVVCLGLPPEYESEGFDRHDMRLPETQYALVDALASVCKNIVVVLLCGAPVELPFIDKISSLLIAYLPGEAGGEAIKDVLSGTVNPSGKLAETWPFHYVDVPSKDYYPGSGDISLYKESVFVGYRYYQTAAKKVLFPFGYGLSYSKFVYSDFALSKEVLKTGQVLKISIKVTNKSKIPGSEIVQLYISGRNCKVFRPLRELRSFTKIALDPGASKTIIFSLSYSAFAFYETTEERMEVEGGQYLIEVSSSSEDPKAFGFVSVLSNYHPMDKRPLLPSYYNLTREGSFRVSDEEFERLLDHPLPKSKDRHKRPFTLNSTLEECSWTFAGKKIKKSLKKSCYNPDRSEQANNDFLNMVMDSPIRMMGTAGYSDKKMLALLALINRRPLKALFLLQFGHRK